MSDEKTIWDGIVEYLEEQNIDFSGHRFFRSWPVIAGVRLSSCSYLDKVDSKKGKIYVKVSSLSSRSLLMVEKKRIIDDWNRMFPETKIKEVVVAKGY